MYCRVLTCFLSWAVQSDTVAVQAWLVNETVDLLSRSGMVDGYLDIYERGLRASNPVRSDDC
jgi:hypothetical protein